MELRQLRYFVEIAQHLHYGKAAQTLFVSQPALSQQIRLLENEIGVELFTRQKRQQLKRVELTEAGHRLLAEAQKILQLSKAAIEIARNTGTHQKTIRIGIHHMSLRERLVELMQLFGKHFPDVNIKLVEFTFYQQVQEAILEENVEFGLTLRPQTHPDLASKLLKEGVPAILMRQDHPLTNHPSVTFAMLKEENWVEISRSLHPLFDQIEELCLQDGYHRQSRIVHEVSSFDLLCSMVSAGIGIAFIPSLLDTRGNPGLVMKPLLATNGMPLDCLPVRNVLVYKKKADKPLIRALLHLMGDL